MSQNNDNGGWVWVFLGAVLGWIFLILLGLWLISAWLTRMLVKHMLNPLLDDLFDRHDGLLIIGSALLWGLVALFLLPWLVVEFATDQPLDPWTLLFGSFGFGLAWGISVGVKVLFDLWVEVLDQPEPTYEIAQVLDTPVRVISPSSSNGQTPLPEQQELAQEIFGEPYLREEIRN